MLLSTETRALVADRSAKDLGDLPPQGHLGSPSTSTSCSTTGSRRTSRRSAFSPPPRATRRRRFRRAGIRAAHPRAARLGNPRPAPGDSARPATRRLPARDRAPRRRAIECGDATVRRVGRPARDRARSSSRIRLDGRASERASDAADLAARRLALLDAFGERWRRSTGSASSRPGGRRDRADDRRARRRAGGSPRRDRQLERPRPPDAPTRDPTARRRVPRGHDRRDRHRARQQLSHHGRGARLPGCGEGRPSKAQTRGLLRNLEWCTLKQPVSGTGRRRRRRRWRWRRRRLALRQRRADKLSCMPNPPLRLLRLANPAVCAAASLALCTVSSAGRCSLLAYRGHRSGRAFEIPLRYVELGDGRLASRRPPARGQGLVADVPRAVAGLAHGAREHAGRDRCTDGRARTCQRVSTLLRR